MSPPVSAQYGGAAWWRPLVEAAHQVGGDDGDDGDDRSHPQHRASWARADTINGMSEPPALTQILDPSAHRAEPAYESVKPLVTTGSASRPTPTSRRP